MISVTRLNGQPMLLNVLFIEKIEALPDTTITLVNGKKLIVSDQMETVGERINHCLRKIGLVGLWKKGDNEAE